MLSVVLGLFPTYTVADPWAVVVEPLYTVVTDGAVRGPRRPEDLTREAVFQLHRLALHLGAAVEWNRNRKRRILRIR